MDDPAGVRSLIGFLTSELKLEDVFSPDYLFDFFSELHHVDAPVRDERKRQLFARFGIDRFAQTKVADLSTGMKQKASLAISLVHDPRVIIFDEPTNGLDVLTAKTVTDFLLELAADGRTVLLSTTSSAWWRRCATAWASSSTGAWRPRERCRRWRGSARWKTRSSTCTRRA